MCYYYHRFPKDKIASKDIKQLAQELKLRDNAVS